MIHLKNKVLALLVVIAFFMTSVLPHQVAFADSGLDALEIEFMEEDDNLIINFSGANASTYAQAVDKIVVNGHAFSSGDEVDDTTYTRDDSVFTVPSVWAPYKKNVIEIKTRGYGERVVDYTKDTGKTFAEGFEITSVALGEDGAGQDKAKAVKIGLSHNDLGANELSPLFNYVTKFSIDDTDYPMRGADGYKNFILFNGAACIYAKYPDGNKAVADFQKREKHKVVMFFSDGSSVEYKDDGYVSPNSSQPPTPPNPPEPSIPEPENGLAKKYTLESVEVKNSWGTKELVIKTSPELIPSEVKTVQVNGKSFVAKDHFRSKYDHTYISFTDEPVVAGETKTPIDLVLTFTDNSTLKTNHAPSPQPPQPSEEKMGDKYKITNFSLEKETDEEEDETTEYLKILVSPEMTEEDLKKIASFTVNDQVFDYAGANVKKIYWTAREKCFRGEFSEVVAAVKHKNPVKVAIQFNDNTKIEKELSLPGNVPTPPQPPAQKMGEKYQIDNLSLEKDNHSKDFLKVSVDPEMVEEDLAKVASITVNDTTFDYSEADKKIYWSATDKYFKGEAPEVITAVKSKNPVKVVIKFKDNSEIEKESSLAGNDPTPNPGNGIAQRYTLGEVSIKTNYSNEKMLVIGLSPLPEFADKQKMTKLIVNGKEFPADKFFISLMDGFYTTDEEVVSKAETTTNIGLAIHFEDGSILKNQYADQEFPKTVAEKALLTEPIFDQSANALSFKLNLKPGEAGDLQEAVKKAKLVVNEVEFAVKEARFEYDSAARTFKTKDADVIEAVKKAKPAVFQLLFADGSKLGGKAVYQGSSSTELDNLANGTYTLSYAAYQAGSNQTEHSVLENFFDVRAKLVVKDGVKTVTLLNTNFPEMLVDFAIKKDGQYTSMNREEVLNAGGKAKEATYTISLNRLSGLLEAKILGTGMMGGQPSDKGNYESKSYRPVELVFKEARPDWKGFEKHEKEEENRQKNDAKLNDFFVEHFDTNHDGVVSEEEFAKAKGVKKTETFASFNNALDLTGMNLTDISLLSKVGGDIDAVYLEGNKVESLPANVFSKMKNLRYIFLSGNNVSELSPKAFEGLTKLAYLDINASPLGTVPAGTFDTNKNLQILSMADCSLVSLPKDLLKNNKKLVQLFLGENKLERLDDDFFSGQDYHLDRVDIANNHLKALPTSMKNLTGLTQFSALNNDLTELSEDTFAKLKKLKKVDLGTNHINQFPLSLARNMIMIANSGTLDATSLDLSLNNISSIPVEAMFEQMTLLNGGQRPDSSSKVKGIKYLNIDRNNLKTDLTEAEKRDLKLLGIAFTDGLDTYYPQNANSNMKAEAKKGKINLKQDFSILEMEYWALGDLTYFQGKEAFESAQEFLDYLLNGGRKYNGVDMSLSREDAIVEILKGGKYERYEGWRVNTKITKNGNVIYDDNKNTSKEPLEQVFTDADMKAGDTYTLTKTLYTKVASGLAWKRTSEYSTTFKATASADDPGNPQPQPENTMKAYIVTKDGKNLSMADKVFERNVTYKTVQIKPNMAGKEFTLKFKPLTLQGATAQVDTVEYDKMGTWAYMTKEMGKTGEFTFRIPDFAFQVNGGKALEVQIRFTLTPKVTGHDKPLEAVLVLDANDNYQPPSDPGNPQPQPEKTMKAYVVTKDKKNLSMADKVFERNVTYQTVQIAPGMAGKEFTLKFKPMTLKGETAKVATIEYDKMGTWAAMTKESGKDGVFKVQIPDIAFAKTQGKALALPIRFTLTPQVTGHDKPLEAVLVFDSNNNYQPPSNSGTPDNPSHPSEPSTPGEKVHHIPVWVKKADSNEPSVANRAINPTASVVEKDGEFSYKVSFRPISLKFGGRDITGHIVSFIVDGKTIAGVTEGEETSYEFTLNRKVNELPVQFEVDAMKDLGAGAREAILVFNWDGTSAPSGGGGGTLAPSDQKEDVESLISRAEKMLKDKANYDEKQLAKLQSALTNAKDEKSEDNRLALLEMIKAVEKTKKDLKKEEIKAKQPDFTITVGKTYMKGYSDGTFRPNKAMTRAEVASVLASLIENKATDQKGAKDVRQGAWYAEAISKALSLGYMKGYGDGSFKPNEGVTRAEYAAILVNVKGLKASKAMHFKDMKDTHWAKASIVAAVEAGIMSGYGDGLMKPDKIITRAEFVAMTNRAFGLKKASGEAQSFKDVSANHWAYAEIVAASKKS